VNNSYTATEVTEVHDSANNSYTATGVTVDDLTPGSFYTFRVTAISSQGLESNNIACENSTSEFDTSSLKISIK